MEGKQTFRCSLSKLINWGCKRILIFLRIVLDFYNSFVFFLTIPCPRDLAVGTVYMKISLRGEDVLFPNVTSAQMG